MGSAGLNASHFLYAGLIIVLTSVLGFLWVDIGGLGNVTRLFFAGVLIAGYRLGMWPAVFAAVLAFFSYNYFFEEPRFILAVTARDVRAFTTFLLGGLLIGGLTGHLSDRARQVRKALTSVTTLFEASRDLSVAIDPAYAAQRVLAYLETQGCTAAIWLLEGADLILAAASKDMPASQIESPSGLIGPDMTDEVSAELAVLPLRTGGRPLGVVAVWRQRRSPLPDARWLRALLDLAAIAIDRARLVAEIAEARVIAEKEGLRTALLSSLSHDLRTPLATILASATSLQEYGEKFDAETRRDLLETIQDESERLNRYVANLLEMTRLESGALNVARSLIDPREAMAAALRRMERRLEGHPVVRVFAEDARPIDVNPVLVEQALMNVIENAVEHAPAESPIQARVDVVDDRVRLSVEDEGEGIAPDDIGQVFEKFFRGGGDRRRASGVGLGLSVTRGLIESFGGSVHAVSPARNGRGTRIELELPAHRAMQTAE